MNYTQSIRNKVSRLASGEVFSADTLGVSPTPTTRKILSRLESEAVIRRLEGIKGFYFIPKEGVFGPIKPTRGQLLKALLNGRKKGYRSGLSLYNKMGLTTQVPGGVTIVSEMYPKTSKVENLDIRFQTARAPITDANILSLQYLDVLMDIKKIPDTSPSLVVENLKEKFEKLEKVEIKRMVRLSANYPKRVQALLGAILDDIDCVELAEPLRYILRSGSTYNIGIDKGSLAATVDWNIR